MIIIDLNLLITFSENTFLDTLTMESIDPEIDAILGFFDIFNEAKLCRNKIF